MAVTLNSAAGGPRSSSNPGRAAEGSATVNATITGSYQVRGILTATPPAGTTNPTYQWKSNGTNISGATSSTYQVSYTTVGTLITCSIGSTFTPTGSTATANVPAAPTIGTLTASASAVSQAFTMPTDTGGAAITNAQLSVYKVSDNSLVGQANGATSPITLSGLTNNVAVYGKVAVMNGAVAQYGDQSAASNSATPVDINYSVYTVEANSSVTTNGIRAGTMASQRTSVTVFNPSTNVQTLEFALSSNANSNYNVPTTGWQSVAPGAAFLITDTDATKQIYTRVASASAKAVTAVAAGSTTSATYTVPAHGIPVGTTVIRSFDGFTAQTNLNLRNFKVTAATADTVTATLLAASADATVMGVMYDAAEALTFMMGEPT